MSHRIVCFGELLLRLTAPGRERLLQTGHFDVHVGGAEANVAVSLAQFGHKVAMASTVADNDLGEAATGTLRRYGVDTRDIARTPGRMGLYFLSTGAVRRPSQIVYDRAGSAFAEADPAGTDWPAVLDGAKWLHISGVTPAIGPKGAAAAQCAVNAAIAADVKISFDGNYRAQLWANWDGDGPAILRGLLEAASLAFINERDISLILGQAFDDRDAAYTAAFRLFPRLDTIAATTRTQYSVDHHAIAAEIVTRDGHWRSKSHELVGIIDRIGGGDAFAAGVLHGLLTGMAPDHLIEFAAAASALKHSIPGDFNLASVADVEAAIDTDNLDVRR
jgi:2-dehydro-3-deoxygluconokinase